MDIVRAAKAPSDLLIFIATGADGATYSKTAPHSAEYYAGIEATFGIKHVITAHQVHSADIIRVTPETRFLVDGTDGDGLFTADRGLALGILTADCYPVMLAGEFAVAALHCGWRGAVGGIIAKALPFFEKAGDRPLYAYVGAGISKDAFEVKEDFIQTVSEKFDISTYLSQMDNSWRFDLLAFITDRLAETGVETVEAAGDCTYSNRRFHSYRRDGIESGRMLTVIHRRPVS